MASANHQGLLGLRLGMLVLWFGIITGLTEGLGMLLFQWINWQRWGPMVHVSGQIVWISMLVDLLFLAGIVLTVGLVSCLVPRISALSVCVFLLSALAVYDWLVLTGRLRHLACILLAAGTGAVVRRWFDKHQAAALQFWKRTLPWVVATGVLAFVGIEGGRWLQEWQTVIGLPAAAPDSPNVLMIVVDTLRADHLSGYGYPRPTSPVMDRMGREGVVFEQAISTTSWSFPSHVSLLTGRYQFEHGLDKIGPVPLFGSSNSGMGGYPTLGEELARVGYRTGAFSANRTYFTGNLGFGRGFAHFEDYFDSPADAFLRTTCGKEFARLGLNRKDSALSRLVRYVGLQALLDKDTEEEYGIRKRAQVVNRELLAWIDRSPAQHPFFAFLNYFDVHSPYGGPPAYPKPDWGQAGVIDRYDDGVKYVDDSIGRLMSELEKRGLGRKTLVVITSDHGEALGQHSLKSHGKALYVELIHVPLILWYPGHLPAAVKVNEPVTNAAIPALVLDVLHPKSSNSFPGPGLDDLVRDSHRRPDEASSILSELSQNQYLTREDEEAHHAVPTATSGPMKSLINSRWHLIVHKKLAMQLYDWTSDPGEASNLIQTPAGQQVARQLISQMQNLLAGSTAKQRPAAIEVALRDGRFGASRQPRRAAEAALPVDDYYRVRTEAGSTLTFDVHGLGEAPGRLDPVVAITDGDGNELQTCRNPGDDDIPPPGVADPTPSAFDDICNNDDLIPGVETDSRLQVRVPGNGGTPVELTVHVSDWNGRRNPYLSYQIAVREDREARATAAIQ